MEKKHPESIHFAWSRCWTWIPILMDLNHWIYDLWVVPLFSEIGWLQGHTVALGGAYMLPLRAEHQPIQYRIQGWNLLKGLWRGGLCEPNKHYIWIPHVFLHMLTNFQLSRTTSWGIIAFVKSILLPDHFHIQGIPTRCVMSQVQFHTEPNDNLYKRVDVVISEFCENSLETYMELVGFTH